MARPKFNKKLIPVALVAIIVAVWLFNWAQDRRLAQAPPEGSGDIEATEIEVGPQVAGRIAAVLVDEGDTVKAGQVIARLDDVELRAQLQQAVGQRDAALNTLRNLKEGSRSQQIAAARATLASAEAAYAGAQRNLASAETGLAHSTDVKQGLDAAQAQVRALSAQLASAKRQAAAAGAQAQGAVRGAANAQAALQAVTELRQQKDAAQGQVETARASRERAASALSTSRADFDRASSLFQQGAIARRDMDNARLALDTARTGLDAAEAQLTTAQATLRNASQALDDRLSAQQGVISAETSRAATEQQREAAAAQVRQAAAQLAGARLALANASTAYNDRLQGRTTRDTALTAANTSRAQAEAARQNLALLAAGNTQATLRAAEGQLKAAQGAVALAKRRLEEAVVTAPQAGSVSTVVARAGEVVSAGLPIVKMLDLPHAYVRVYLPFASFGKVKVGDPAKVDTDAVLNRTFNGKATSVATEAEFTPKNVETRDQRLQRVYWVKVSLENPDGQLKPGMPAHAVLTNR
ncbi:MAG TPA: biotin/lipoyl-binding protein [Armatimonadota bacterium]|jgi:multidrug resistance efflux pump